MSLREELQSLDEHQLKESLELLMEVSEDQEEAAQMVVKFEGEYPALAEFVDEITIIAEEYGYDEDQVIDIHTGTMLALLALREMVILKEFNDSVNTIIE